MSYSQADKCQWAYNNECCNWGSECGLSFILSAGSLEENEMECCPKCGKGIGLDAYKPEDGDFYWTEESFNRVKEALEGDFFTVPSNLKSAEEFEAWLLSLED